MKHICSNCKYSKGILRDDSITVEWHCEKKDGDVIFIDESFGKNYYQKDSGPECPIGLFKQE